MLNPLFLHMLKAIGDSNRSSSIKLSCSAGTGEAQNPYHQRDLFLGRVAMMNHF